MKPPRGRNLKLIAAATLLLAAVPCTHAADVPGDQRRWTLDLRIELRQSDGAAPIAIHLSGEWISTVSSLAPGESVAQLELSNPHIEGMGAGRTTVSQLERRLARRFWSTYRADGGLVAFHFHKDVEPGEQNLLQTIATALQFVQGDPGRLMWTAVERDAAGEYLAVYHRTGPGEVLKRKLKYVQVDGAAGAPPSGLRVDVSHSEFRFTLSANNEIASLAASEQLGFGVPIGAGPLVSVTEIHLSNPRRTRTPEVIGSLSRAVPDVIEFPVATRPSDQDQVRQERDRRLIEGKSTPALLHEAANQIKDHLAFDRLVALFRLRPEAPEAALVILRGNRSPQLTNALASAGSPAAIEALRALAKDPALPSNTRSDALSALVLIRDPSIEAMRLPLALLDDEDAPVATAARMASGSLAHAGRAQHPAEAESIDAALSTRFQNAGGTQERCDLLGALGNSAGGSVIEIVVNALGSPNTEVRAAAARALRLAGGTAIDREIAAIIESDEAASVRAAAIFAASFRHPVGPVIGEALVHAASLDPADFVRSNAISMLRQNPDSSARLIEVLEAIAVNDKKPEVRRQAREALESLSPKLRSEDSAVK